MESPPIIVDPVRPRRGGRPRKPADDRRGRFIGFWMTAAEEDRLAALIEAGGFVSVSDYLRAAAFAQGGESPRPSHTHLPELAPLNAQLARSGNNLNQLLKEGRVNGFTGPLLDALELALKAHGAALCAVAMAFDWEG